MHFLFNIYLLGNKTGLIRIERLLQHMGHDAEIEQSSTSLRLWLFPIRYPKEKF